MFIAALSGERPDDKAGCLMSVVSKQTRRSKPICPEIAAAVYAYRQAHRRSDQARALVDLVKARAAFEAGYRIAIEAAE